jgi:glycosyltransferase involved in cell wall biosynthesis
MPAVRPDVELVGVSGRHGEDPSVTFDISIDVAGLAASGHLLYELSLRLNQPKVERILPNIDLVHCTSIIPFATAKTMVATVHDLAFLHHPDFFTRRGNNVFRRSIKVLKRRADMVLCSSMATVNDCLEAGFNPERVRHVPLGVRKVEVSADDIHQARAKYSLPREYLLFVGTLEPRKNLERLVRALALHNDLPPMVVAGAKGWGDVRVPNTTAVQFIGHVEEQHLAALYAGASTLCYPSVWEGFGLPILEAMAQGVPVVTSQGTSTEEVAGGAAVLVDALDEASIAHGIETALTNRERLAALGKARSTAMTWEKTAIATAQVYDEVLGR